eukprot:IDg3637t1
MNSVQMKAVIGNGTPTIPNTSSMYPVGIIPQHLHTARRLPETTKPSIRRVILKPNTHDARRRALQKPPSMPTNTNMILPFKKTPSLFPPLNGYRVDGIPGVSGSMHSRREFDQIQSEMKSSINSFTWYCWAKKFFHSGDVHTSRDSVLRNQSASEGFLSAGMVHSNNGTSARTLDPRNGLVINSGLNELVNSTKDLFQQFKDWREEDVKRRTEDLATMKTLADSIFALTTTVQGIQHISGESKAKSNNTRDTISARAILAQQKAGQRIVYFCFIHDKPWAKVALTTYCNVTQF